MNPATAIDSPPAHSLEAEKAALGAIIVDNDRFQEVAALIGPRQFWREAHGATFAVMRTLRDRGEPIDCLTLTEELRRAGQLELSGGPAYLASLSDGMPRSANAAYYAKTVREKAFARDAEHLFSRAIQKLREDSSALANGLPRYVSETWDRLTKEFNGEGGSGSSLGIFDDVSILEQPDPQALIPGYYWQQTLIVTVAPPTKGKTTLFISKGLSIAGDKPWMGLKPSAAGPVALMVGEGAAFVKDRVLAGKLSYGLDLDTPVGFHVMPDMIDFRKPREVDLLINRLRPLGLRLFGIDTLNRAMPGGDNNSQQDMGLVIASADRIRQELGCAVELIHHTGWNEDRERGSSSLRGDVDTLALLSESKEEPGVIALRVEKQKDGAQYPELPELRFRLQPIELPGGRSACVAVPVDSFATDDLAETHTVAFDVLRETFPNGTSQSQWLAAMPDSFAPTPEARRQKLYRVRRDLLNRGWIDEQKGKLVVTKPGVTKGGL